jgi:threonine/homoserine/homoserine lactone efflux protein
MSFIEGFLVGLATVIFFGPVFFTILNGTLQYGTKAGMMVTVGIITSDLACVLICSLAAPWVTSSVVQLSLTIVGTIILLAMGIKYLVKPIRYSAQTLQLQPNQYLGFFTKGFLVNFTSPFTFAYWLGAVAYGNGNYTSLLSILLFVFAILLGIFTIDVLKVLLAKYLKNIVQPKVLKIISIACGIILIGFAIRMAWYLYTKALPN